MLRLADEGCSHLQGYLFGRPGPIIEHAVCPLTRAT
jgi:EAL domain-containing protein (putative c-di-GMP-specific phosphodiesterase class I)